MKLTKLTTLAAAAVTLGFCAASSMAQDNTAGSPAPGGNAGNNGGGGNRRGGGQGGGNFDPAQFQQRMNQRIKDSLKATDDEWAVIQPLLEKVQTAQMASRMGGGGRRGGGGPGGGGPGGQGGNNNQGNRPNTPTMPEAAALQAALDADGTSADEIKTKLAALRDARKKATANLEQARADLEKVLTVKQEATLVLMGMLE